MEGEEGGSTTTFVVVAEGGVVAHLEDEISRASLEGGVELTPLIVMDCGGGGGGGGCCFPLPPPLTLREGESVEWWGGWGGGGDERDSRERRVEGEGGGMSEYIMGGDGVEWSDVRGRRLVGSMSGSGGRGWKASPSAPMLLMVFGLHSRSLPNLFLSLSVLESSQSQTSINFKFSISNSNLLPPEG